MPSEQEEVVATKRPAVWLKEPEESSLKSAKGAATLHQTGQKQAAPRSVLCVFLRSVLDTYASELNGSAMGTACGEQPYSGSDHVLVYGFNKTYPDQRVLRYTCRVAGKSKRPALKLTTEDIDQLRQLRDSRIRALA